MKIIKRILKWINYILILVFIYLIISLIFTEITVDRKDTTSINNKVIYIQTNGVHLDIILSIKDLNNNLLNNLIFHKNDNYISFGWGDENFYINTPTWNDLTFKNAFQAMFMKSTTLLHVTSLNQEQTNWVKIEINENELNKINNYIFNSFKKDGNGNKIILKDKGYSKKDNFYKAKGSYSCFKTCNSWVNSGFIESDLKSCYWTPFDFGLINKYK